MKCPIDGETLMMSERSGVEIDYCPKCRGVWLDRGELDKIIDEAAGAMALPDPDPAPEPVPEPQSAPEPRVWQEPYRKEEHAERQHYEEKHHQGKRYKGRYSKDTRGRKKGRFSDFLEDIFDFD